MMFVERIRSEQLDQNYKSWLIQEYVKLGWYFQGESSTDNFPHSFLSFLCEGEGKLPIPDSTLYQECKNQFE